MSEVKAKRYAAYKESGVEWLGEIPANWIVTRNKDIFGERGSLSQSGDETLLTVSHITGVTQRAEKNVNMFMAESMEGYKHCKIGDMIINTMWAWMGALGTAKEDGICSPAYGVYAPRKDISYNHKYFDYLYRIPKAVSEMTRNSKGIVSSRLRLYPRDFFQILTALPSYKEQTAIAAYLDTKNAQIDRKIDLLSKKAMQYGKLKQSLINETVTRGLDKTMPMKESGVEWLGEVPEHWEIGRLKNKVEFSKGINAALYTQQYIKDEKNNGIHPVYSGQTENEGIMGLVNTYEYNFPKPVIFVTTVGANAMTTRLLKGGFSLSQNCALLKVIPSVSVEYINYYLSVLFREERRNIPAYMQPSLRIEDLKKHILLTPSLAEQTSIAAYLDKQTAQIDRIIAVINSQIDKLKELRKTLINDVITGKIKVINEEQSV